jgi:hypothetical protein
LGCPEGLVLNNVACEKCNNELGRHVDRALVKQFEIIAFMAGVPRKKGKPPTSAGWAPLSGKVIDGGPEMIVNGGPGTQQAHGKKLPSANKSNGIYDTWVKKDGRELRMGFTQDFGTDPRFLPALFKIGLNLEAKFSSPQVAAGSDYDHIRSFVRGEPEAPNLTVAVEQNDSKSRGTGNVHRFSKPNKPYPMFQFEILGVFFLVDMAPDQPMLRDLRGAGTLVGQPVYVLPTATGK